jgi:hypothetical protein
MEQAVRDSTSFRNLSFYQFIVLSIYRHRMRQLRIEKIFTNHEDPLINKYFIDIGKEKRITKKEEIKLSKKIKQ